MRVRLTRIYGPWRRDSNLLADRRARLDARLAMLIWPAPLCSPSIGLAAGTPAEVVYLTVAIETAEVPENDVPIVAPVPASWRVLISLVIRV
jgi:hypothetical protein